MKRTQLERRTPITRKTRLRVKGHSETADLKEEIQNLVRAIVILRDGGCILRDVHLPFVPECNGYKETGELILQADHLISRANSATYADTRLIVCVCKGHHGWKSVGSNKNKEHYDLLVRGLLSDDRVALWDRCESDSWRPHRAYAADWKLSITALRQELAAYE